MGVLWGTIVAMQVAMLKTANTAISPIRAHCTRSQVMEASMGVLWGIIVAMQVAMLMTANTVINPIMARNCRLLPPVWGATHLLVFHPGLPTRNTS